jgi:hypothetical protein
MQLKFLTDSFFGFPRIYDIKNHHNDILWKNDIVIHTYISIQNITGF